MIYHFDSKELNKISKAFIPFLIAIGSLRLILFYNLLGIKIIDYLNFTEVLVSFAETAMYYFFTLFIPIFILNSFWGKKIAEANNTSFQEKISMSFIERVKYDFKQYWIPIILFLVFFILSIIKGTWNLQGFLQLFINPGMFIALFVLREIRITYKKQYNFDIPHTYINIFLLSYLFITLIIQDVLSDVKSITTYHKFYGTEIIIGDEKILTDSTFTYIGQTKDFIFFKNLQTKRNTIYPKKDLKKITFKDSN